MVLRIGFNYTAKIDFAYWFLQTNTTYSVDGEMVFDMDTGKLTPVISKLGLSEYRTKNIALGGDYLTLDTLTITPKLFGNLLKGQISIDLWGILRDAMILATPLARLIFLILDFLIYAMFKTVVFSLDTYVEGTISPDSSGASTSISVLTFTEDSMTIPVELDFTGVPSETTVEFIISELNYVISFTADWYFVILFHIPFVPLLIGLVWYLGTNPSLSADLLYSNGGSFTIDVEDDTNELPFESLFLLALIPIAIINKKRKED
jgi:hypothetical protein